MNVGARRVRQELTRILARLDVELAELDRIGAGIAAVHVNAAVEHLRHNLDVWNDNEQSDCKAEISADSEMDHNSDLLIP